MNVSAVSGLRSGLPQVSTARYWPPRLATPVCATRIGGRKGRRAEGRADRTAEGEPVECLPTQRELRIGRVDRCRRRSPRTHREAHVERIEDRNARLAKYGVDVSAESARRRSEPKKISGPAGVAADRQIVVDRVDARIDTVVEQIAVLILVLVPAILRAQRPADVAARELERQLAAQHAIPHEDLVRRRRSCSCRTAIRPTPGCCSLPGSHCLGSTGSAAR